MSLALEECRQSGELANVSWADLGARGRADYVDQCRRDWARATADLTSPEIELALDVCRDTRDTLDTLTCDDLAALYTLE